MISTKEQDAGTGLWRRESEGEQGGSGRKGGHGRSGAADGADDKIKYVIWVCVVVQEFLRGEVGESGKRWYA